LIAGTSGGGKSNFFRQALIGLLKSSPHLQLYLLDLKKGIEVVEFQDLPNVRIAADEATAVQVLKSVHAEMEKRFIYLMENKKKKINPIKDQKDLIVVAIDEADLRPDFSTT
jgi:DNA segregation ATPase FtsK/SpoIIIE-like protein